MKAVDYYNKFLSRPTDDTIDDIFKEFCSEVVDIINTRNATKDSAVFAVIQEQNNKWNAMIALFDKHNKTCPFKRNAIWNYYASKIPELNKHKNDGI